jgi:hypothetical protein
MHTPTYAADNPFGGNSTEQVSWAFCNWLLPRIWAQFLDSGAPGDPAAPTTAG